MKHLRSQTYFYIILLLAVFGVIVWLFKPYFSALLLATVFAVLFSPIYARLNGFLSKYIKWRSGKISQIISAFAILIIFLIILFGPLTFLSIQLSDEVGQVYNSTTSEQKTEFFKKTLGYAEEAVNKYLPDFSIDIEKYLQQILGWMAQNINSLFQGIGSFFLAFFLSLLGFYYLLKDGAKLKQFFIKISPLPDKNDRKIIGKMKTAINNIVRGSLTIAIIQGFLTGVGFFIFGVPNPTLAGTLAAIAALIPTVGTALVLIPGIAYLLFTGKIIFGIGLLIWGVIFIGLIDNLLGPYLMKGENVHPFLILLSVLGGLSVFGPLGFLIGPLIVSLFYALLDSYIEFFK